MSFTAKNGRNKLWFGTEERMTWFPTPLRGADVSSTGWESGGTLLNGGGFQLNSFGSARNYMFEWSQSSSRQVAQMMKSYADGTYGRGLIYFQDPLTWTTNVLPAMWADPSMGLGYEGASLVYGVDPEPIPTSAREQNDLPVRSAYYDLGGIDSGWRGKEQAVFVPIPEGMSLALGAFYTRTGSGGVFYREQSTTGALGTQVLVSGLSNSSPHVVDTIIPGGNAAGVWLYVGKSASGSASVTLSGMVGRLIETGLTTSELKATNLFTNPRLVGDGTWAEVRRNRVLNQRFDGVTGWSRIRCDLTLGGTWLGKITVTAVGDRPRITQFVGGVVAGDLVSAGVRVTESGVDQGIQIIFYDRDTTVVGSSPLRVRSSRGEVYTSAIAPEGTVQAQLNLSVPTSSPLGTVGGFQKPTVEVNPYLAEMEAFSPGFNNNDPDIAWEWVTDSMGESVAVAEGVAGFTSSAGVFAIKSEKDGRPAVRMISSREPGATNYTQVSIPVPVGARGGGTVLATRHQESPFGATSSVPRAVLVQEPTEAATFENSAGVQEFRVVFDPLTSVYRAYFYHGGDGAGSSDIWWTDIGLYAGDYDGPVFNGSSGTVTIAGRNYRTQWDGPEDNSSSSAWTMTPELDRLKEGPWVGGQGHSGCRFVGKPTYINNTGVDGGQVSFAASFKEVGSWLYG